MIRYDGEYSEQVLQTSLDHLLCSLSAVAKFVLTNKRKKGSMQASVNYSSLAFLVKPGCLQVGKSQEIGK